MYSDRFEDKIRMHFFFQRARTGWTTGEGALVRALLAAGLLLAALAVTACQPQIGDPCRTSQNCRPGHLCDDSVPGAGGYCTIFDCREGECPSGSICVRFDDAISACMATCDRNRDCRPGDGIVCRRDVGDTPFCYAETEIVEDDTGEEPSAEDEQGPAEEASAEEEAEQ